MYVRFARWEGYGVGHRVAEALKSDADLEDLFIDSTIIRAHPHVTGAPKKTVAIRGSAGRGAGYPLRQAGQSIRRLSASPLCLYLLTVRTPSSPLEIRVFELPRWQNEGISRRIDPVSRYL